MKKYILYSIKTCALLIFLSSLFVSCEDFLEKPVGGDITIDTIFTSSSNAQQLIFSLYHDDYFNPNNIAINWWDQPQWYASWSEIGENIYYDDFSWMWNIVYVNGTMSPTSDQIYPLNYLYRAVRIANTFIEMASSIDAVSQSDQEYIKKMKGEAHAHLAYQYYRGMRLWGSLPWIGEKLNGGEEPVERIPYCDFVDSIVYHLDIAASLLPDYWEDRFTGRFTSVAAKTLKARVLVYAASPLYNGPVPDYASGYEHPEVLGYGSYDPNRWKIAADACLDAINAAGAAGHALYNESGERKNIYHLSINLTDEHILYQRYKTTNLEGGWFYVHNMMNWPHGIGWYKKPEITYQPTLRHVDRYQMINGKFPIEGYVDNDPTQPVISSAGIAAGYDDQEYWKDRDNRFEQNIVRHGKLFGENYNSLPVNFDPATSNPNLSGWAGFKTNFIVRKFVNEALGESPSIVYTPVNPIIRLADLYLLYAEALSEYNDGPTGEGLYYFNQVRARSGMPDYNSENYPGG
ncbi:MAG TPA: hypothetical protein DEQ09_08790, partial [Bacteroidales bacterium]|nr:hypothetical protein [Bacteroidales bacterium]